MSLTIEQAQSLIIKKLEDENKKLKGLILLTDSSVSNVEVGDLQLKQWQEFLRCFPELEF